MHKVGRIVSIILAALAAACGGSPSWTSEPNFDGRFALRPTAAATVDEQRWPARSRADCLSSETTRPVLCLEPTNERSYRKGEVLWASMSWRNAPANASIIVYLEHDAPAGERYLGAAGALVLTPIAVTGNGTMTFRWNGREFPCAPTDFPMLCKQQAEIGRYRLRAALYDRTAIAIVGWPSPEQPIVLSHTTSTPFLVTGAPDLQPIARTLWWAAMDRAMRGGEIGSSLALAGDMNGTGLRLYERHIGRLCADIPANPPYLSTLEACVPKANVIGDAGLVPIEPTDVQVSGHVTVAKGGLSREDAVKLAQAVADEPYLPRVAFHRQPQPSAAGYDFRRDGDFHAWSRRNPAATTYLSDSVSDTVYRPDLGGGWVIIVNEIMAGGSLPDDQRFADKVLVLVGADRHACVIETAPYRGVALKHDPKTAALKC